MKYPYSSYNTPLPGYGTSLVDRINIYLHFRRYFKIISDRWLLLLVTTVAGTAIGCYLAFTKPNIYLAKSVLMIAPKTAYTGPNPEAQPENAANFVDQQITLMQSHDVINKVQSKISETAGNSNKLAATDPRVIPGKGNTFVMQVTCTNLDYARQFATAWAQEFVEYKKFERENNLSQTETAILRKIMEFDRKLATVRDELSEFRRSHNIANAQDASLRAQQQLAYASDAEAALKTELALYEGATAEQLATSKVPVKDNPASAPASGRMTRSKDEDDPGADQERYSPGSRYVSLILDLREAENNRNKYTNTLRVTHPHLRALDRELESKRAQIQETLRLIEDGRLARINSLRIRIASYEPLIKQLRDSVLESQDTQNELDRQLSEEKSINETLSSLNSQLIAVARNRSDDELFHVVDTGVGDDRPISPNKPYIIASGVAVGIIAGVGIMFLLHRLDDRLENPEAIEEALEEPIMGQLPEVDKRHYKEGYLLLTRMKSHTMFAESLRGVRSALLLSAEGSSKRFIAVTSAVPGDGKTTFTTNFAITLANSGAKTLLVDADLRRGNVHGYFEQPLEGGLSEVLQGKLGMKEAVRETGIPNLFFMRAGERPGNPSELLLANTTRDLIRDLRAEFDYVIFDCPPLTAIDDTFSIAAYLDGLFFVIRAGRTSMRFAKMGINTIRQRGTPVLGLIVNGVPIDNPYYYYTTYYYASYYHRPLKQDENALPERRRPGGLKAPALPPGMQMPERLRPPEEGGGGPPPNGQH